MFIYFTTGEMQKLPVSLQEGQSCGDKLMELVKEDEQGTGIFYKGKQIRLHFCKTGKGEWVQ
jgi:hypothetical protein|tara:strand:+ start:372 stop:557 length:186 start_codon:yes stop_codon:yes gene_type:complete